MNEDAPDGKAIAEAVEEWLASGPVHHDEFAALPPAKRREELELLRRVLILICNPRAVQRSHCDEFAALPDAKRREQLESILAFCEMVLATRRHYE